MLVDFMIIGAQKAGTSSLCEQLAAHPEVCFSSPREPAFFSREPAWHRHLDRYHAAFSPRPGQRLAEGSTEYTMLPQSLGTAERLHAYNPGLRLVYLMRDPVERMRSHHAHRRLRRTSRASLADAVHDEPDLLLRSLYSVQLRPYLSLFPREQLVPVVFEEHVADPARSLRGIAGALGLDPEAFGDRPHIAANTSVGRHDVSDRVSRWAQRQPVRRLAGAVPAPVRERVRRGLSRELRAKDEWDAEVRGQLRRALDAEIDAVEALLGRPVPAWREGA